MTEKCETCYAYQKIDVIGGSCYAQEFVSHDSWCSEWADYAPPPKPKIPQKPWPWDRLPVRISRCLASIDVECVEDLAQCAPWELLLIPNFGEQSLQRVVMFLGTHGLKLSLMPRKIIAPVIPPTPPPQPGEKGFIGPVLPHRDSALWREWRRQNFVGPIFPKAGTEEYDCTMALRGDVDAMLRMVNRYQDAEYPQQTHVLEWIRWMEMAKNHGNGAACNNLGVHFEKSGNNHLAIEFYAWGARYGNYYSLRNLGVMFEISEILAQDLRKALDCYRLSLQCGYTKAQTDIDRCEMNIKAEHEKIKNKNKNAVLYILTAGSEEAKNKIGYDFFLLGLRAIGQYDRDIKNVDVDYYDEIVKNAPNCAIRGTSIAIMWFALAASYCEAKCKRYARDGLALHASGYGYERRRDADRYADAIFGVEIKYALSSD